MGQHGEARDGCGAPSVQEGESRLNQPTGIAGRRAPWSKVQCAHAGMHTGPHTTDSTCTACGVTCMDCSRAARCLLRCRFLSFAMLLTSVLCCLATQGLPASACCREGAIRRPTQYLALQLGSSSSTWFTCGVHMYIGRGGGGAGSGRRPSTCLCMPGGGVKNVP